MHQSIRIGSEAHEMLKAMSLEQDRSLTDLAEQAISDLRRRLMLEKTNEAYATLRQDKDAWEHEQTESKLWEAASLKDATPNKDQS